jgi:hypothetical protein
VNLLQGVSDRGGAGGSEPHGFIVCASVLMVRF